MDRAVVDRRGRARWRRAAALAVLTAAILPVAHADAVPQFVLTWGSQGPGDNQFSGPRQVATDAAGNVYVADTGNNRVKKFTPTGDLLRAAGTNSFSSNPGFFNTPEGVAVDSAGTVYVSDGGNNRVQKFDSDLNFLLQWGGLGFPAQLAVGGGSVYVANRNTNSVLRFTTTGTLQNSIVALGSTPTGVALDSNGNVLLTDQTAHKVRRFTPTGTELTGFGSMGSGAGQFQSPGGVATDAVGNIYVADQSNDRIQKFAPDGSFISAFGGTGTGTGQFMAPLGVTVDRAGNIYVADTGNSRIEKFVEPADLTAAAPAPVTTTVGQQVTLSMGGANSGPGVAFLSTVTVSLPPGLTLLSATPTQGSCALSGQTASCALGAVAATSAPRVTVGARADAPVSGNTTVTLSSPTLDGTASNNSASGTVVVTPAPTPGTPGPTGTKRLTPELRFRAVQSGLRIKLLSLTLLGAPKGSRVVVSCSKGCRTASRKGTGARLNLLKVMKRTTFRTGTRIEVRVTAPAAIGRLVRLRLTRTGISRTECGLRAGTGKPFGCAQQ